MIIASGTNWFLFSKVSDKNISMSYDFNLDLNLFIFYTVDSQYYALQQIDKKSVDNHYCEQIERRRQVIENLLYFDTLEVLFSVAMMRSDKYFSAKLSIFKMLDLDFMALCVCTVLFC